MIAWLTIPAKRPPETSTLSKWRAMGYGVAVQCDPGDPVPSAHFCEVRSYRGYAEAVNHLIAQIRGCDPLAQWFIVAGDDIEPDPVHTPDEIAKECGEHFRKYVPWVCAVAKPELTAETFGVMQPTGDRWGADEPWAMKLYPSAPAYIDRICGSAWFGREYCRRMYGGRGPLFDGYFHMREDEEAQEVAIKMGVFWQRRDLVQHHHHAQRKGGPVPDFLKRAYSPEHWKESTEMFEKRKAAGFPGHEAIA